ncbi:hypothetical protein [Solicola gregarius]|uniref:Uncharacterized protein n=1 Tax=Solicola gregarius TaxID=2908642 RepID=A0AA46TME2_9ACTN|nr:hypothetical protein [Solicola gregarius]UYM07592.1 hypothetical protein L0C25_11120 [Solicola gregarius]
MTLSVGAASTVVFATDVGARGGSERRLSNQAAPVSDGGRAQRPRIRTLYPVFGAAPGARRCGDDPDGGDGHITCQTDNRSVKYYMDSHGSRRLEKSDRKAVRNAMRSYRRTDLSVRYDRNPDFTGSSETDVVYQEGSRHVSSSKDGVTWCDDAAGVHTFKCDQQYVRIRGNGVYRRPIACHETGHAIGLVHGDNANPSISKHAKKLGCMTTPSRYPKPRRLNRRNINYGF